jgi:hypothetical protein
MKHSLQISAKSPFSIRQLKLSPPYFVLELSIKNPSQIKLLSILLVRFQNCHVRFSLLGLAGITTGTVIHSIYKYPETGKKTLIVSTLSGTELIY